MKFLVITCYVKHLSSTVILDFVIHFKKGNNKIGKVLLWEKVFIYGIPAVFSFENFINDSLSKKVCVMP